MGVVPEKLTVISWILLQTEAKAKHRLWRVAAGSSN
jgi:hypothetical protein